MKTYYNPTPMRLCRFEMCINDEVEMFLTSPTNSYVVFNGKAEILFEGTLAECFIYYQKHITHEGFEPSIYSIEAYKDMVNRLKKLNSFEDKK